MQLVGAEDAPGQGGRRPVSSPPRGHRRGAADEVPEWIEVDVSGMEIGDTLRLEDLPTLEGVTFLDDLQRP